MITHQAHIVTAYADELGDAGVILLEQTDGVDSAHVATIRIPQCDLFAAADALAHDGWTIQAVTPRSVVGYFVADVTR